jgi:hypothetical protein
MARFVKRFVLVATLGVSVLGLSACAGHEELTAPCSLSGSIFSANAFAAGEDCGELRLLNR